VSNFFFTVRVDNCRMGRHQAAGMGRVRLRASRAVIAGLFALCAVPTAQIDPESQVAAAAPR
jgi:hypothetical protein